MPQPMRFLVVGTLAVFSVGWAIYTFRLQRRFLSRLKIGHSQLWASLGCPALPSVRGFRLRYAMWFWSGGFDCTGDVELGRAGARLRVTSLVLVSVLALWGLLALAHSAGVVI